MRSGKSILCDPVWCDEGCFWNSRSRFPVCFHWGERRYLSNIKRKSVIIHYDLRFLWRSFIEWMTLFRRFSCFVSSENRKTIMLSSVYVQVAVTSDNERLRRQLGYLRKKTVLSDGDISGMDEIIHRIAQIYEQCRLSRFEKTVLPVLTRLQKMNPPFHETGQK